MKKGDKVLVRNNNCECYCLSVFDHEHDGIYYTEQEYGLLRAWRFCKPAKQSVDEWSDEWLDKNTNTVYPEWRKLMHKYYNDRKKWEETL